MITLGRHSYIGDCHYLLEPVVEVGHFTSIASQVIFMGTCEHPSVMNRQAVSNFPFSELRWGDYTKCGTRGTIRIGSDVWIGQGAVIMDGVKIGDGAIVGAGALVARDVPDYAIVVGNPARVKRMRFNWETVDRLRRIAWWNKDDETVKIMLADMQNVDEFVEKYNI